MPTESVKWRFVFVDQMSGPARQAQRGVDAVNRALRQSQRDEERRASASQRAAALVQRAAERQQRAEAAAAARTSRAQAQASAVRQRAEERIQRANAVASQRYQREQASRDARGRAEAFTAQRRFAAAQQREAQRNQRQVDAARARFERQNDAALSTLGGMALSAAAAVTGIALAFARVAFQIGEALLNLAAFRESTLTTLRVLSGGDRGAARRQFGNAITIANQTPDDTQAVAARQANLRVAGYSERETTPLLAGIADIQAARGNQAASSAELLLSQFRGTGRVDGGDLRQLQAAGIGQGQFLDSIARQLGINNTDERARRLAARQAITARRVTGDQGTQALLDSVRSQYNGGGPLGTLAREQSNTLTGSISNLSNALPNLALRIATEDLPGVQALQRNIVGITNALDTSTASGRRFRAALAALINTSGGGIAGLLNPERLLGGMERLMGLIVRVTPYARAFTQGFGAGFSQALGPLRLLFGVMTRLVPSLSAAGDGSGRLLTIVTLMGRGFGLLAGVVAGAALAFVSIGGAITAAFATISGLATTGAAAILGLASQLGAAALSVGRAIVDGLVSGITSIPGRVASTVSGVAHSAIDGVRDTLGIHSPSRVMMELGANTAEGFALGVGGGGPSVNDALSGLVAPPAAGAGLRGGTNVSVYITVQGASSPEDTAAAVGDELVERLAAIFGRLAEATP